MSERQPPESGAVQTRPTYSVLLIELDPKETELYVDLIREVADCRIDVMSKVRSSFDWIDGTHYQLVVADIGNVDFDPLALLERIKRVNPATGVVFITGEGSIDQAVTAMRMGAEDYLKKPFNPDQFKLAVRRCLDRNILFEDDSGAMGLLNLVNSCQMISASLDQAKIFKIIQSYFSRELQSNYTAIYQKNGERFSRIISGTRDFRTDHAMEEILDIAVHGSNPFQKVIESEEEFRFFERGQLTPGLFVFRFKCAGPAEYFCVCLSPRQPSQLDAFANRLRLLKTQIEVSGKNIEQYMGVKHLAYVDDATGLYNTRYLNQILDREIAIAKKKTTSFAVLFIDADRFKGVNDQHGHLAGTKLLNELGKQLKKFVRESDTVFRYGGDEFVAVLSPCDLKTATVVAERIRQSVEKSSFLSSEGLDIRFTVSIGVALFPDHAASKKAVIKMADQAMYCAKKKSRNTVYVAHAQAG